MAPKHTNKPKIDFYKVISTQQLLLGIRDLLCYLASAYKPVQIIPWATPYFLISIVSFPLYERHIGFTVGFVNRLLCFWSVMDSREIVGWRPHSQRFFGKNNCITIHVNSPKVYTPQKIESGICSCLLSLFSCLPLTVLCVMWLFPLSYSLDLFIFGVHTLQGISLLRYFDDEAMELISLELDFHFTIECITVSIEDRISILTLSAWKLILIKAMESIFLGSLKFIPLF